MNLRRRQKRKKDQALDAVASATKRASKGVKKAKELRPPSRVKRFLSLKWVKIGGAAAVAGGTAVVVGRKLKGDEPEVYTGPPPSAAADVAVPAPDTPAPLSVAPDPATQERDTEPASGPSALRSNRPTETASVEAADPELVSDSAPEKPAVADDEEPAAVVADDEEPAAVADDEQPAAVADDEQPAAVADDEEPAAVADDEEPAAIADDEEPTAAADDEPAEEQPEAIGEAAEYLTVDVKAVTPSDQDATADEASADAEN